MINPNHLLLHVIRPVLEELDLEGESAERLLLETAMHESSLCHLQQLDYSSDQVPRYGIYQMDEARHRDTWKSWLAYKPAIVKVVRSFSFQRVPYPDVDEMHGNLYYATAMARVFYRRVETPIPETIEGRAEYWSSFYDGFLFSGDIKRYLDSADRLYKLLDVLQRTQKVAA